MFSHYTYTYSRDSSSLDNMISKDETLPKITPNDSMYSKSSAADKEIKQQYDALWIIFLFFTFI